MKRFEHSSQRTSWFMDLSLSFWTFLPNGVRESRVLRREQVFACPEGAQCDAGQAGPPDSKTNIGQVAESRRGLGEWWRDVGDVLFT